METVCETRAEQVSGKLQWTLRGFSLLDRTYLTAYERSRRFRVGNHEFSLVFYPGSLKLAGNTDAQVAVAKLCCGWLLCNHSKGPLTCSATVDVTGRDGRQVASSRFTTTSVPADENGYGVNSQLPLATMLAGAAENGDSLTLNVEVILTKTITAADCHAHEALVQSSVDCLGSDMKLALDRALFSDVCLRAGGRTFPAHKVVLAARSPVLATMLASGMQEAKTGIIEIADMEVNVVSELLHFLYVGWLTVAPPPAPASGVSKMAVATDEAPADDKSAPSGSAGAARDIQSSLSIAATGATISTAGGVAVAVAASASAGAGGTKSSSTSVSSSSSSSITSWFRNRKGSSAIETKQGAKSAGAAGTQAHQIMDPDVLVANLLIAADRFQIASLALVCAEILSKRLNVDNFADMLMMADRHHNDRLKARCIEFVTNDKARLTLIKQTDAYKRLDRDLLVELLEALAAV